MPQNVTQINGETRHRGQHFVEYLESIGNKSEFLRIIYSLLRTLCSVYTVYGQIYIEFIG